MTSINDRIAFIGGGNMARSLIGGLLRTGTPAAAIAVAEPNAVARESLAGDFGVHAVADNAAAARDAGLWVLAVKPQVMDQVLSGLAPLAASGPVVVSIAAGVPIARMQAALGPAARIVRTMPNTPALIGAGVTGLCAAERVDGAARDRAEALMAAAGATAWIADEALMDVVTAVSGSGPAYFFLLIESLIAAGIAHGLSPEVARTLASHTALGAARMAIESGEDAATLRQRVTSPGGTTAAALASFESEGFRAIVARAVAAATRRGRELAGG
jgi:pyrroline-5-carboxylate reductase